MKQNFTLSFNFKYVDVEIDDYDAVDDDVDVVVVDGNEN